MAPKPIRTITHEDRLSLIEHLEELRNRLIVSAIALAVAFGVCLWQNHALLNIVNKPLETQTQKQVAGGHGPLGQTALTQQAVIRLSVLEKQVNQLLAQGGSGLKPGAAASLAAINREIDLATAKLPRIPTGDKPVTLGIGEPFTTTITVTFYFALLVSLPIILFQLYSFVLPAFSPGERKIAMPLMMAIPFLFATGVLFGYFVVLPASVKFFQNFNSDQFNVLVQAGPYLKFAALIMLAMGLIFQVPVGILAATRAGVVTPKQLRANRRYAIVVSAVIAALLPGDAVTMALETAPLIFLYEISIRLASAVERRANRREARETAAAAAAGPAPGAGGPAPGAGGRLPAAPVAPAGAPPVTPASEVSPAVVPPLAPTPEVTAPPPRPVEEDLSTAPPAPVPAITPPPLIPPIAPPIRPNEEDDDAL
jgi:sec-independent protein translocase protein TatC